jgi:hypothetical protein
LATRIMATRIGNASLLIGVGLGLVGILAATDKKTPSATRGENEDVVLEVTLYDDPMLVQDLLGNDLGGHYMVADVKIDPKFGKEIVIDRDDFVLRTEKDGEHTTPFAPSQIVDQDAVLVSRGKGPNAASPGMVLEGPLIIKGGGPPPDPGVTVKASQAGENSPKQEDPLKKLLEDKILPEKKTADAVTGLLYFPMEKQKRKDLELDYGPRETRIRLRFK